MDLVKRNAEIVALLKAGNLSRRKIAARYRLHVSTISLIAIKHGVRVRTPNPKKVWVASELINRGMPLTHVAQTVGFNLQTLRRILEDEGLYVRSRPTPLWPDAEVRILSRDYGKRGLSVTSIAAKLGRTPNQVMCKAAGLGLKWPVESRANLGSKPALTDRQQAEVRKRLAAGEAVRSIAGDYKVHPNTVKRLKRRSCSGVR
jgi:DNA-binding CsgD family transcriptional regulator